MASKITQENHLWDLLTTNQVENIQTTLFLDASPRETTLPETIHPEAVELLQKLQGRIFPVALRGKSQAGKSTTLNRIAKITNFPVQTWLSVGKTFGSTTTYGIWLVIITFKNHDALLLFDLQGTDRGANEVTYKLIAFTDHICTKVVDVFRMSQEGFSNEYINTFYCLANARDSVKNLKPTSNKAILWTNCHLPRSRPFDQTGSLSCHEPKEYHFAVLQDVSGDLSIVAEKAKNYTESTPIFITDKCSDEITPQISDLDNDHPFIRDTVLPTIKNILTNVPSAKIESCEIQGTVEYVQYLENIYKCVIKCDIDLPYCQSSIIKSMALANLSEQKKWISEQLQQIKQNYSQNWSWIAQNSKHEIDNKTNDCIQQFEDALNGLARNHWNDQLESLKNHIQNCTRVLVNDFKIAITEIYVPKKSLELNDLCTFGHTSDILKNNLDMKKNEIIEQLYDISVFKDTISHMDKHSIEQSLENHINELYHIQQLIENKWSQFEHSFTTSIYEPDSDDIDHAIDVKIRSLNDFSSQEFEKYNIRPKLFFDMEQKKQHLKQGNNYRANQKVETCKIKYMAKFNSYTQQVLSMNAPVETKYAKLLSEHAECLNQYYNELGSPLNEYLLVDMHKQLKQKFDEALDKVYTPEVQEELKNQRIAQMEHVAKFTGHDQEALAWIHCIECKRIFAGRTKGCEKVECDYTENINYTRGQKTDYVCGRVFEWKKARPVNFNELPQEFWLSPTEARGASYRPMKLYETTGTVLQRTKQTILDKILSPFR